MHGSVRASLNLSARVGKSFIYYCEKYYIPVILSAESGNPGECTFDNGMCGFVDDVNFDDFDWKRNNMNTKSYWTGPKRDHTRGNSTGILYQRT